MLSFSVVMVGNLQPALLPQDADLPWRFCANASFFDTSAYVVRLFLPRDKDAEELIHREPALLFVRLDTVVRDIRRLMPTADPRTVGDALGASSQFQIRTVTLAR